MLKSQSFLLTLYPNQAIQRGCSQRINEKSNHSFWPHLTTKQEGPKRDLIGPKTGSNRAQNKAKLLRDLLVFLIV